MLRTQMVVHRWGPKTRGLALFDRGTNPEFSIICDAGY